MRVAGIEERKIHNITPLIPLSLRYLYLTGLTGAAGGRYQVWGEYLLYKIKGAGALGLLCTKTRRTLLFLSRRLWIACYVVNRKSTAVVTGI